MSINDIAQKLLVLREQRNTGLLMAGTLREELGFEGYGEAIRRRWIVPDESGSGMVTVTNHLGTVAEIRQLAAEAKATCQGCKDGECTCMCKDGKCSCKSKTESINEDAHMIATSHAFRQKQSLAEYSTLGLGRTGDAPVTPVVGLGKEHSTPASSVPAAAPSAAAPEAARQAPVAVGADVRVVENGKEYVGKVSQVKPDGKYAVSFAADKPAVARDYDKTEVSPLAMK